MGVEPIKSPHPQCDRFSSLRTRSKKWRVRGSHPAGEAYETSLSTGPPASIVICQKLQIPGSNRAAGLMRANWAPAASALRLMFPD